MIDTLEEFLRCADSDINSKDIGKVTQDQFADEVWKDLLMNYPNYHEWIAHNRYLPEWMMWEFSRSEDKEVREIVARRYDAPETLLQRLSKDTSEDVRFVVSKNMACPRYLLEKLSQDRSPTAREGVAQNMRCPKDLLRKLAKDKSVYVRDSAKERLEIIQRRGIPKIPEYWHISPNYEWVPDPNPDE